MPNSSAPIPRERQMRSVLSQYQDSFCIKAYKKENDEHDVLMDVFGISPALKRQNRQYWGRELGMCWQLLVIELFRATLSEFKPGYREGRDELCDLISGTDAIDTKYRIGCGDSGTLKKFKQYGRTLRGKGFNPVLLIVRRDNLRTAIRACEVGGWDVLTGARTFDYVSRKTGVCFDGWLASLGSEYHIRR